MSRKIIAASIILLMFGGVSTASGFFVNDFLDIYVQDQMDEAFLEIQSEAIPIVEEIVNETFAANMINLTTSSNGDASFFNDATIDPSIAWHIGKGDLYYTAETIQKLLYGDLNHNILGLISDTDQGTGVDEFLNNYYKSSKSSKLRDELASKYLCPWENLTNIVSWFFEYAIPVGIPLLLKYNALDDMKPELIGLESTKEIAKFYFKAQWANASLIADPGFALPLGFMEVYGLEVGIPVATNMSVDQVNKLWDKKNEYSIVNKMGIKRWFLLIEHLDYPIVNSLKVFNGNLSDHAVECLVSWLYSFKQNVMPYLAQYKMNLPTDSTTIKNIIQMGCIAIGGLASGLAGLGLIGTIVTTKKSKNVKKIRVPARSGSNAFLGGLPKRYSSDLGQAIGEIPSEKETQVDKNFKFKNTS